MALAGIIRPKFPEIVGRLVFLLAAIVSGAIVWQLEQHDIERERGRVAHLAGDHAHAIEHAIDHALSVTQALAALVRQGHGSVPDFEATAGKMLPFYPGVSELALAPGGVIRDVAPRVGNERALGLDLLASPTQRKESLDARDSGRLTLAGPLELAQGGTGVVGRLPVFLEDGSGHPVFWGFTLVVMRLPGGLDMAHLSSLDHQHLAYELWRIHPDNGKKQIIARSSPAPLAEPVEQALHIPNATWTLSVAPPGGWVHPVKIWTRLALGILVSLMLGYLARIFFELRAQKQLLEARVGQLKQTMALDEHLVRPVDHDVADLRVLHVLADGLEELQQRLGVNFSRDHGTTLSNEARASGAWSPVGLVRR